MPNEPTIGRIVIFQRPAGDGGIRKTPAAAIITSVHDGDMVDLTVFPRMQQPMEFARVPRADAADVVQTGELPFGTWSWPDDARTVEGALQGRLAASYGEVDHFGDQILIGEPSS